MAVSLLHGSGALASTNTGLTLDNISSTLKLVPGFNQARKEAL